VAKAQPSSAKTLATPMSVATFLAALENELRQADAHRLAKLFAKATGWKATMWGPSIVGYGRYAYTYDSGRSGEMCLVGFSPRKAAFTLYLHASSPEVAAQVSRLGKVKVSGGCIHVKKLEDVDLGALEALIKACVASATKEYTAKGWRVSGS
jgi:hypothetical protein